MMSCCCSLRFLYKVHAIELDLQLQLHQGILFSHYSSTELSKERLLLIEILQPAFQGLAFIHFFALNKAIHRLFLGSLVTIIANVTQATCKASRSRCLFVSNLLHSYYCFEYNFTVRVTWYFHENFKLNDKLALGLYPSIMHLQFVLMKLIFWVRSLACSRISMVCNEDKQMKFI